MSCKAAIIYDYDGTLARGNIQECSFIPEIGMSRDEFWDEVRTKTKKNDADEILVYMNLMIQKAHASGIKITKEELNRHGKESDLYEGLEDHTWFSRINDFAASEGLELEHYIISSGIYEMIQGSPIFPAFKKVFASQFMYENGEAIWPNVAVNYTTKTQYLFRINKGIDNQWDNSLINAYMPENQRPILFENMIFIGDGDTDIPSMKMMTQKGGHSIAVYDPACEKGTLDKIHRLISDGRVDFVAPADYSENSQIDIAVRGILGRMAHRLGSLSE